MTQGSSSLVVRMGPAVDRWLVAVLALCALLLVGAIVAVALLPGTGIGALLAVALPVMAAAALVGLLAVPVAYELDDHAVRVRAGVTRVEVALRDVVRVERFESVLASPTAAWTARRLRLIDHAGRVVELGPADRDAFVAALRARAPHLAEDPSERGRAWAGVAGPSGST